MRDSHACVDKRLRACGWLLGAAFFLILAPGSHPVWGDFITLNFNATSIPADGWYIWFNSVFKPSGIPLTGLTHIYVTGSSISLSTGGTIPVPTMIITLDPSLDANTAGAASLSYDSATSTWLETLPGTGLAAKDFLNGVPWQVATAAGNADAT